MVVSTNVCFGGVKFGEFDVTIASDIGFRPDGHAMIELKYEDLEVVCVFHSTNASCSSMLKSMLSPTCFSIQI